MKIYSNDAVTFAQVEEVAQQSAVQAAEAATSALDEKQSRQIKQLRVWCGVLTAVAVLQIVLLIAALHV